MSRHAAYRARKRATDPEYVESERARSREYRARVRATLDGIVPEGWRARRVTQDGAGEIQSVSSTPEGRAHSPVVPEGHSVRGVSTLVDASGAPIVQWVKTSEDRAELTTAAIVEALSDVRGVAPCVAPPRDVTDDIIAVYPIGDPHWGLLAWEDETGESWDLRRSTAVYRAALSAIVALAPSTKRCVIAPLGDYFHADDPSNRTPRGGNVLDVDGRHAKTVRLGTRFLYETVLHALTKHSEVQVEVVSGNHDITSSAHLRVALELAFEAEPRVTVSSSSAPHRYVEHGSCLLGFAHGHEARGPTLGEVMACDQSAAWGRTRHRHVYHGHIHSLREQERPGVTIESVRTLTARDAWAHAQGYRSGREVRVDAWHRAWGRVSRHAVTIDQVRAMMGEAER